MTKKTTQLKNLLTRKEISFLMEAHNGLSAKIAQEAGFEGIWASGLSISASLGVRDNNEISWSQVVDVLEYMSDATDVPILVDGDTGHGNFNNMRRFVKKLEQRNIAGVCIEDKIFPKTNSFLRDERQPLANIEEFCGKIKAGVDSRSDTDFCILARVEAFISGWGLDEALKRAHAYEKAGADAILIHSKISKPDEIFAFMNNWNSKCPVVIVPTKYYSTPTKLFEEKGISTVIWANHLMRTSLTAMQNTAKEIYSSQSLINVEDKVAPLSEVFRLQDDKELQEAEKRYLKSESEQTAIILAADGGQTIAGLTESRPKAMIEVQGEPLISKMVRQFESIGVKNINIVTGHKEESFIKLPQCHFIKNEQYQNTGELLSLFKAVDHIEGDTFISYGDIMYKSYILNLLKESDNDFTIVVDSGLKNNQPHYRGDFVTCTEKDDIFDTHENNYLLDIETTTKQELKKAPCGEWIGLLKINPSGAAKLKEMLLELSSSSNFKTMTIIDLFKSLMNKDQKISVTYINGHWMDIDSIGQYEKAQVF